MPKSVNERKTESLIREAIRRCNYYADESPTRVEEQKSSIAAVSRLLKSASKSGKGGTGAPEFIISSDANPDFLIVIECKADTKFHVSKEIKSMLAGATTCEPPEIYAKRVQQYAVDGAFHYSKALSKEYNVIAIGASGETPSALEIDSYLYPKNGTAPKLLTTKQGEEIDEILPWDEYIEHATFDPAIQKLRHDELMEFARELHDFMRDHAKLTESEKPLVVSGTLIALRNKAFISSYDSQPASDLQQEWLNVIRREIEKAEIPKAKKASMAQPYSSIAVHPELGKATKAYPKGVLNELIRRLNEKVWPFISVYHDFDVVGQFYGEFLKYTGGDKKALGIVLTPRHVTDLCARLANANKKSKVLDICAGTGGFLISAMALMFKNAKTKAERETIRRSGLIGVEQQPNMYALAASNMILRGDGKANLYQGSCFDAAIEKEIKRHRCDIGLLNPPFSQGDADLHELVFVKQMLDCLIKGGTGIAIVPISCAISTNNARKELLKAHTLEAVMSMPDDLFYPVGTVTCLMVFTAHKPHTDSDKKTWFGYWKSDGFIKTKHRGRVDIQSKWEEIRDRWVNMFRNREVHPGESVTQKVSVNDEWCAEAYMRTDYSNITPRIFEKSIKDYTVFQLLSKSAKATNTAIPTKDWQAFTLGDLFEIKKGKRLTKLHQTTGETPFIGSIDNNNGVSRYIGQKPIHEGGTITVNYNGSVAKAFYQPAPFWASDDVNVLYPKGFKLTPALAMFIISIIELEKYRFNYGRKWHLDRMRESEIYLPIKKDKRPDFDFMEKYIQQLPFSAQLAQS